MPESSPKSGGCSQAPGEAGVCLGSPLNSLINLAQCFHFPPWPANPAHVCGCLSLCLPALHVSVSFLSDSLCGLLSPAQLPSLLSCSPTAPVCLLPSSASSPPSSGLRRTETSPGSEAPPFPLFAQHWQHTAPSHLSLQGIQGSTPESRCLEALSRV